MTNDERMTKHKLSNTPDRVMNLAGKKAAVTFDQSGSGRLNLTGDLLYSGCGASKTLTLQGDTAGLASSLEPSPIPTPARARRRPP